MIEIKKLALERDYAYYRARGVGARGFPVGVGLAGIKRVMTSVDDTLDARLTIHPH
jgi:hypothetical protein